MFGTRFTYGVCVCARETTSLHVYVMSTARPVLTYVSSCHASRCRSTVDTRTQEHKRISTLLFCSLNSHVRFNPTYPISFRWKFDVCSSGRDFNFSFFFSSSCFGHSCVRKHTYSITEYLRRRRIYKNSSRLSQTNDDTESQPHFPLSA